MRTLAFKSHLKCVFIYKAERDSFCQLVSSPKCLPQPGLKLSARNETQVPHMGGRTQLHEPSLLPLRICIIRKLKSGARNRNQVKYSGVKHRHLNQQAKCLLPYDFTFLMEENSMEIAPLHPLFRISTNVNILIVIHFF